MREPEDEDGFVEIYDRFVVTERENGKFVEIANQEDIAQKFINSFVTSFLHPYITGRICKENELKNRRPMMELLLEQLPKFDLSEKEIEEIAFHKYLEKAALGLYTKKKNDLFDKYVLLNNPQGMTFSQFQGLIFENRKRNASGDIMPDITPKSPEFNHLIYALEKSIAKDFPKKEISKEELNKKASKALISVNKQRSEAVKHAFPIANKVSSFAREKGQLLTVKRRIREKEEMLEKLKESGKLFVDA